MSFLPFLRFGLLLLLLLLLVFFSFLVFWWGFEFGESITRPVGRKGKQIKTKIRV
jgi:hypothetical protein